MNQREIGGADRTVSRRGYLIARGYVVMCGIFLSLSMFASQVAMPELYYDDGPVPPWQERAVDVSASLGYALLLVLPFRWSVRGRAFWVRFALLLLASLWLCYCAATGIYGLIQGRKHWLVVPASVFTLGLAVLAPGTLVARRKRSEA